MFKNLLNAIKSEFDGTMFSILVLLPLLFAVVPLVKVTGAGALVFSAFIFLPLAGLWAVSFTLDVCLAVKRGR